MANDPKDFDELRYLYLNPDVEAAVLRGEVASGWEHWRLHGRAEGRPASFPPASLDDAWDEASYLRLNPDVSSALRARVIRSGQAHWSDRGQFEARPGAPNAYGSVPMDAAPAGINLYGFHDAAIGLGAAARGYAEAFRRVVPVSEHSVPWDSREMANAAIERGAYRCNVLQMNPDALPSFLNRHGGIVLPGRLNVGIWLWELHAGYALWHALSRIFREIWAPTNYVAQAIRTVSAAPVEVVPIPVGPLPESEPAHREEFGFPSGVYLFLYVFDVASTLERKNPLALIRAFREAFGNRRDTRLILKFQHAANDSAGANTLLRITREMDNITVIAESLPAAKLTRLLRACDCFVSPHRAEGFGLNIANAMYLGKPVIATGYSGNIDFTLPSNSFLIDYDLVEVRRDTGAYRAGYVWAEPSERHLARLLRLVYENPGEAQRRGAAAGETIRTRFSVDVIAEMARKRLVALEVIAP